jgi:hypothetical protein
MANPKPEFQSQKVILFLFLGLTERLILDGKSADNASKEEMSRAVFE